MPWNYPFWQVMRCAVPAMMAGNTILLKHAPNVLACGNAIADMFHEAGFPDAAMQHIIVDVKHCENIILHPHIKGVSLTGSRLAGESVSALAGRATRGLYADLRGLLHCDHGPSKRAELPTAIYWLPAIHSRPSFECAWTHS